MADRRRILVIEAYCSAREAYEEALHAMGHRVLAASCAAEALRLCARHAGPPSLVLTAVRLPDEDGRVLVQRMRGLYAVAIPVIYVTAWQVEGLDAGLTASERLFRKPVDLGRLERAVRELLAASASQA